MSIYSIIHFDHCYEDYLHKRPSNLFGPAVMLSATFSVFTLTHLEVAGLLEKRPSTSSNMVDRQYNVTLSPVHLCIVCDFMLETGDRVRLR